MSRLTDHLNRLHISLLLTAIFYSVTKQWHKSRKSCIIQSCI